MAIGANDADAQDVVHGHIGAVKQEHNRLRHEEEKAAKAEELQGPMRWLNNALDAAAGVIDSGEGFWSDEQRNQLA